MISKELTRVNETYRAMQDGIGTREDYHKALNEMNGPRDENATKYFVVTAGNGITKDDNDGFYIFNDQTIATFYVLIRRVGGGLYPITKSELLKQLDPETFFRLNPDPNSRDIAIPYLKLKDIPD